MMIEFWWKVFLASIVTVGIAKVFGSPWGIFLLFSIAFIGWTVGLIILIWVSGWWWEWGSNRG